MSALRGTGLVALTPASQSEGGTFLRTRVPPLGPSSQTSLETQAASPPTDFFRVRDCQPMPPKTGYTQPVNLLAMCPFTH